MQLRWTTAAADDLEGIAEWLFDKSPQNAAELIRKIYQAPSNLKRYPNLGRPGKKEGTCELVLAPLPYIVVYQITGDTMYMLRILHGAQDWPV
jgi:plasmid stabilization system protein ParE